MTEGSRSATEIAFSPAPSRAEHNPGPLRLATLVLLDHSKLETGVMFVSGGQSDQKSIYNNANLVLAHRVSM